MDLFPLRKNTAALVILAMLAALGILVRSFISIPVVPGLVELTPGFLFSILGGVIGGVPGGVFVGAITGLGGALAGNEPPLLPMIGNIFLGVGGGYAIHLVKDRDGFKYATMVILGSGIIGGFIPSATIFASLTDSWEVIVGTAAIDMFQGFLWGFIALILEKWVIRPVVGHYIYRPRDGSFDELEEGK